MQKLLSDGKNNERRDDLILGEDGRYRCAWVGHDPLYRRYHDEEWGVPVRLDSQIFECLCLEGFQAGLSWITILRKREAFRAAFAEFDFRQLARWPLEESVQNLLQNKGIIRHRGKIEAVFKNAQASLALIEEFGSFWDYLQLFMPKEYLSKAECILPFPSQTPLSISLSKDLKKRGFSFVGPKTVYAFMQAQGMVNDHQPGCFRRSEIFSK